MKTESYLVKNYVQVSRIILSHNEFHNEKQTLKIEWICWCAGAPSAAFPLQQDADIAYNSALKNNKSIWSRIDLDVF